MAGNYMPTRQELTEWIIDESELEMVDPQFAIGSNRAYSSLPIHWRGLDAIVTFHGYEHGSKETNQSWRKLCYDFTGLECPSNKTGSRRIYRNGFKLRRDVPNTPLTSTERGNAHYQDKKHMSVLHGFAIKIPIRKWNWPTESWITVGYEDGMQVI